MSIGSISVLHIMLFYFLSPELCKTGLFIPVLQMKKQAQKMYSTHEHSVRRWLSQDLNPGSTSLQGPSSRSVPPCPFHQVSCFWASQVALVVKSLPANAGDERDKRCGLDSWVGKIPWRRAWQPTPVSLPGESRGQRSGLQSIGREDSGTTEAT